jgi:hypothetical protein
MSVGHKLHVLGIQINASKYRFPSVIEFIIKLLNAHPIPKIATVFYYIIMCCSDVNCGIKKSIS